MSLISPVPHYFNERISMEPQTTEPEKKSEKIAKDESSVVGYVKSYFNSDPKKASALSPKTYKLISEQIINIYKNCPALLHQNNFSATIRLYGYNIPINVIQKHHSDRQDFINADSGEKMTDAEKAAFQNSFKDSETIEATKNHIYSSILTHIKKSTFYKRYNFGEDEEKVFKLKLDSSDLIIEAHDEQKIINVIVKVGNYSASTLLQQKQVFVGPAFKDNTAKPNESDPNKSANATPDATNGNDPVTSDEATPDAASGSDPVTSDEATPDAASGSDPVTSDEATPDAASGSDPVTSDEATPDAASGSDPVTSDEATPDAASGSDPVTSDEPTPDAASGSDPVTSDEPTPDAASGSDPVTSDETSPDAATGSDPVTSDEPTPDAASGSDPVTSDEATPDAASDSDPVTSDEATPDTASGSDPVTSDEATPDTASDSDPVTSDEATPDTASGSDPVTSDEATPDAASDNR